MANLLKIPKSERRSREGRRSETGGSESWLRRVCKAGNRGPRGCSLMKNRCSLWLRPRAASRARDAFLGRGQTRKGYGDREGEGGRAIKILWLCKFHVVETQRKINRGSSSAFSLSHRPFYSPCLAVHIYIYIIPRDFAFFPPRVVYIQKEIYRRNESRNKSVRNIFFLFSFSLFSFALWSSITENYGSVVLSTLLRRRMLVWMMKYKLNNF